MSRLGAFSEVASASRLIKVSIHHTDGLVLGKDVASAAVPLAQSLLKARPEVNCVIHTHPKATEVLSALDCGLEPISHPALILLKRTGYVDCAYYHDADFCKKLVDAFEGNVCVLMGNHGMMAVGRTPAEAFFNTFTFDQACSIQLAAYQSGQKLRYPDDVDEICKLYAADENVFDGAKQWDSLIEILDRKDTSYRD